MMLKVLMGLVAAVGLLSAHKCYDQSVKENTRYTLTCEAPSSSFDHIHWDQYRRYYQNPNEIEFHEVATCFGNGSCTQVNDSYSAKLRLVNGSYTMELVFTNVIRSQQNYYVCNVHSGSCGGYSRTNCSKIPEAECCFAEDCYVDVQYAPVISQIEDESSSANEGSSKTFNCVVESDPSSTVKWFKLDQNGLWEELDQSNKVSIHTSHEPPSLVRENEQESVSNSYLKIEDITKEDGGLYKCSAHNEIGENSESFRLNINEAPKILTESKPLYVWSGHETIVTCEASGFPLPVFSWNSSSRDIDTGSRIGETEFTKESIIHNHDTGTSTSVLRILNGNERTVVSCVAANSWGNDKKDFTFTNAYRPKLSVAENYIEATSGSTVNLTCYVDAVPSKQSLFWLKDGSILSGYTRPYGNTFEFNFWSIDLSDSGNYTCNVENKVGLSTSENITVIVTSETETTVSVVETTVPVVETTVPVVETTVQVVETTVPVVETTVPVVEATVSETETTVSETKTTVPVVETTVSVTETGRTPEIERPEVSVAENYIEAALGSTVNLTCHYYVNRDNEPLEIYWLKDGSLLSASTRLYGNTYELNFWSISLSDSGIYTCNVNNSVGLTTSENITVIVTSENSTSEPEIEAKDGDKTELYIILLVCGGVLIVVLISIIIIMYCRKISQRKKEEKQQRKNEFTNLALENCACSSTDQRPHCLGAKPKVQTKRSGQNSVTRVKSLFRRSNFQRSPNGTEFSGPGIEEVDKEASLGINPTIPNLSRNNSNTYVRMGGNVRKQENDRKSIESDTSIYEDDGFFGTYADPGSHSTSGFDSVNSNELGPYLSAILAQSENPYESIDNWPAETNQETRYANQEEIQNMQNERSCYEN